MGFKDGLAIGTTLRRPAAGNSMPQRSLHKPRGPGNKVFFPKTPLTPLGPGLDSPPVLPEADGRKTTSFVDAAGFSVSIGGMTVIMEVGEVLTMSETTGAVSVLEQARGRADRRAMSRLSLFSALAEPGLSGGPGSATDLQFRIPCSPLPVLDGDDWEEDEDEVQDDDDDEEDDDDDYFPDDEDDDFDDDDDDDAGDDE